MAIWNSKDFLSTKFTTAIIIDGGNRAYAVDIKNTIGLSYFAVTMSKQRYVFKIDGQRLYTWRQMGRKTCKFLLYTIDNYLPMSLSDNKELENILRENSLPKVNNQLFELFKYLGKREKSISAKDQVFKEHDLSEIVDLVAKHESEYPEVAENLKMFFERLDIKKIVSPVKHISEMLDTDFKSTDAIIFGILEDQLKRTDKERKAMSNNVKDAKKNWLVIGILGLLIGGGLIFGLYAYSTGAFDHLVPQLPGSSPPGAVQGVLSTQEVMSKYPTPEALKSAIDSGTIKRSNLNAESQKFLDSYKPPVAVPAK